MRLTVLASGSTGNGYVLEGRRSALLLECGVAPEGMMRATTVATSKLAGALVTHEHGDHARYMGRYANMGLPIYASAGTFENGPQLGPYATRRVVRAMQTFRVEEFVVRAFDTRHDAAEPLGWIIEHEELGRMLFLTDTAMCPYDFKAQRIRHMLIEANYDDGILDGNVANGEVEAERAARTRRTHMSLRAACDLIRADQTAELQTVMLIHLSGQNADRALFRRRAEEAALFSDVRVAEPGLEVDLSRNDFKVIYNV